MEMVRPTIHRVKIILEGEFLKIAKVIEAIKKASTVLGFKYKIEQEK